MRAKSHDQRKGQWLINKIRSRRDFVFPTFEELKAGNAQIMNLEVKARVESIIFNMENDEFDKLMSGYNA